MTPTGWILFCIGVAVLIAIVTQFGRLLVFLLNLHRAERKEYTEASGKILMSLEAAIREASGHGTTNIFNADKTDFHGPVKTEGGDIFQGDKEKGGQS